MFPIPASYFQSYNSVTETAENQSPYHVGFFPPVQNTGSRASLNWLLIQFSKHFLRPGPVLAALNSTRKHVITPFEKLRF